MGLLTVVIIASFLCDYVQAKCYFDLNSGSRPPVSEYIKWHIKTKEDAEFEFGPPTDIDYDCSTKCEKWIYVKTDKKNYDSRIKVILIFDTKGKLIKHLSSDREI